VVSIDSLPAATPTRNGDRGSGAARGASGGPSGGPTPVPGSGGSDGCASDAPTPVALKPALSMTAVQLAAATETAAAAARSAVCAREASAQLRATVSSPVSPHGGAGGDAGDCERGSGDSEVGVAARQQCRGDGGAAARQCSGEGAAARQCSGDVGAAARQLEEDEFAWRAGNIPDEEEALPLDDRVEAIPNYDPIL